ncbi:FGGY-family carbohydrate kinase [Dyadobacter fermentans]|uniref:Carbohydrate kinase FGGY n=1 Tax=Dyadobacter fermentans (strain ATCC 700827 / DSM 18053 / CIP 107007 / KCTC 52180 / NS114) TaxID=471854 RepID=C6W6N3_DYAFD|nr:FGGY family carbohydrate kinase [Dyadobacter fermentans]ACT96094.1 carbohydrate kinase FGGY [Dyadobacter fermentans DSM 18053]
MKVTAVFDIGRTNKKYVLFNEKYDIVHEFSESLPETVDEDGFPTEDCELLTKWVQDRWAELLANPEFDIKAVNVAGYGASLVHLDAANRPLTPLYSYLKPFPEELLKQFYSTYGDPTRISLQTGSPAMGMLNSGMQLYWLKHTKPEIYSQIATTLHLPQYILYLLTGRKVSDYTSLGCHTALWSFEMWDYHEWVKQEGIHKKLAPVLASSSFIYRHGDKGIQSGFGLHDSSSALIPYRMAVKKPFVLLSTGTWCINFNSFASKPLTSYQLERDCMNYLTPEGSGVTASRLFMGREHDYQVARIVEYFKVAPDFYKNVAFDEAILQQDTPKFYTACMTGNGPFPEPNTQEWQISAFSSAEAAYHHLLKGLTELLFVSLDLVNIKDVHAIYVDGGFARNEIFTKLLARHYPNHKVYVSDLPYATSLGAALHVTRPQTYEFAGEIREIKP